MTKQKLFKICVRAMVLLGVLALVGAYTGPMPTEAEGRVDGRYTAWYQSLPPDVPDDLLCIAALGKDGKDTILVPSGNGTLVALDCEPWYEGARWADTWQGQAWVPYCLSSEVAEYAYQNDELTHQTESALNAWDAIDGYPCGQYLQLYEDCEPGGRISIEFSVCPYGAVGCTQLGSGGPGIINSALIILNDEDYDWDSDGHVVGVLDYYEILTHELAHALGIAEYNSSCWQIMDWTGQYIPPANFPYGCLWQGNGRRQILYSQDIYNIRCIYQYSDDPFSPYHDCLDDLCWGSRAVGKGLCGDVNGDEMVSEADVSTLQLFVGYPWAYLTICSWCGDVTGNCVIDMGDVALLDSYIKHPDQYELSCQE